MLKVLVRVDITKLSDGSASLSRAKNFRLETISLNYSIRFIVIRAVM